MGGSSRRAAPTSCSRPRAPSGGWPCSRASSTVSRPGGRSPSPTPLWYDRELDVLVQWLPLDLRLPALAEIPALLRDAFGRRGTHVADGPHELLAYSPRRRAVLRVRGHVLRFYAGVQPYERAVTGAAVVGRLRSITSPRLEATLAEHRVVVQSLLHGSHPVAQDVAAEAGALAGRLHRARADNVR